MYDLDPANKFLTILFLFIRLITFNVSSANLARIVNNAIQKTNNKNKNIIHGQTEETEHEEKARSGALKG